MGWLMGTRIDDNLNHKQVSFFIVNFIINTLVAYRYLLKTPYYCLSFQHNFGTSFWRLQAHYSHLAIDICTAVVARKRSHATHHPEVRL
jgi:hypothetical protein